MIRFPRVRSKNTEVINTDDLNDAFLPVIEEASGQLNEHNWGNAAFNGVRTRFADDAGFRLFRDTTTEDPKAGGFPTANAFQLARMPTWQVITGLSRTIHNSKGGLLWVLASFQLVGLDQPHAFGIRVNGQLLHEDVLGMGEENGVIVGPLTTVPILLQSIVPTPPGPVTIDVVVRAYTIDAAPAGNEYVAHRELILVECVNAGL